MAGRLEALGDAAGALPLYRRAVDGFDSLFGPDHPSSRTVRANCDRLERELAAAEGRPSHDGGGCSSGTAAREAAKRQISKYVIVVSS